MTKAQAELDNVVSRSQWVEDADIPNLKYLQVVIKKALKLHPATPLLIPYMTKKAYNVFMSYLQGPWFWWMLVA